MAFENGVNFDEDDPLNQGQQGTPGATGGAAIVGGAPTNSAPSQAGAGGKGGWTNIQNYLNANSGGTGSAQLLDKSAGSQFGQERNNFQNDSQNFLNDAQAQVDKNNISDDQAGGYITQAGNAYQYPGEDGKGNFASTPIGGTGDFSGGGLQKTTPKKTTPTLQDDQGQASDYSGIVDKFHNALSDQYSGPKEYNYGLSADTQKYGDDLKDNGGFDTLMNRLYSQGAGTPLTSGQLQLQKQLDIGNQSLVDSRNKQINDYAQLGADRDKTVQDTTAGLGGIEQSYRQNQNRLKDYLSGKSNDYDTSIGQKEGEARAGYDTDFNTGSNNASINYQNMLNNLNAGGISGPNTRARINQREGMGIWGDNLSWNQLQREQDNRYNGGDLSSWDNHELYGSGADNRASSNANWQNRLDQLNNFYGNEDQKYANTADQDKRSWNAIQDFLNSDEKRRDQQFHVRGS